MFWKDRLSLGFGATLPLVLQTEATECGLACVAMIAAYHGLHTSMADLRRRFAVSLKGATLAHLVKMSSLLGMGTRPVKLELEDLGQLKLPCVLHWNFNHFVVLKTVSKHSATIYDPAYGKRTLSHNQLSQSFTGVALECWPNPDFQCAPPSPAVPLRSVVGRIHGVGASFTQILILAAAIEVFALVSPFFLQWVVDNVLVSGDRDLLTTLALGFGLLMLIQQAVTTVRAWVILYMGTTLNIQWRANLFAHLLRLPVQYFEKRHLGDVVSRFGSIDQIQRTLTTSFLEAILDGLMTLVTLVMMFIYSVTLGWIAVGAMGLYALGRWIWYRPLRAATEEQIIHAAKQQSHFLESMRGIKTIKLFQRQDERRTSWLSLVVDQLNADLRSQKLQLLYRLLNGVLFGLEGIIVVWLGARQVLDGIFTVGVLMAFNSYKGQFESRVSSLIDKFFEVKMLQLQAERLADIVQTEPEHATVDELVDSERVPDLQIVDLCFRYAEHEPLILNKINLSIKAGESLAIVGASGCGKTTLMNVLLGILPPTSGTVLISGLNLKQIGIDAVRQMVGTVLQDDVLFAGSIADNISFFDPHMDLEWVKECSRIAAIGDEIAAMPMGYNSLVGDMGTVLSGGQKQRILLARALYKRPRILFLDEATSHLDLSREHEVNTAIRALNITRIIVAHRPETIASANRIIMMEHGRIAKEMTSHTFPQKLHERRL